MSAAANIRAIRERLRERSLSRDRNVLEDVPAITLREKRGPAESLHFPPRRSLRRLGRRPGIPILRRSARGRSAGRLRPRRAAAGSRASAFAFRTGSGLCGHEAPFRPDCFGICVPFFRKTAAAQVQVPVQASGEDTATSFGSAFKQGLVGFIAHPRRACSLRQKTPNGLIPDPRRKLSRIVFFCFRDCVCSASGRFEAKGAVRAVRGKSVSRRIALPAASPCRMRRSFQRILRAPAVHFFWTRA